MLFEADKVMFEIYRETEYTGKYHVCYFTELQDHNKETEINHALAGEGVIDLSLLVVILQLREIADVILPGVLRLAVDLEHYFIGFKQHPCSRLSRKACATSLDRK